MTISYNWLSEYLPEKLDPEKLSRILTSIGLEVESLEDYQSIKGGLEGIVVGEVLTCVPHPGADKLKLTTVNIGQETPLNIVCGAPNVAAGQKVLVATIGTTLYNKEGEALTIKKAKIRDEESMGMLCAEDELGLGESHDGILVLPADTKIGIPATDIFPVYTDHIYEIGLTPNRMDAQSHMGVARDVTAYLTRHNSGTFKIKTPSVNGFKPDSYSHNIDIQIDNPELCPRYAGIVLSGVKVGPSPEWLQQKLKAIGQRPINNIVDITNFILHETGQPLHAFDLAAVTGNQIQVKTLDKGYSFETLDGKIRTLSDEDLMICNSEAPMCIAGVFGGKKSGVKETTTEIFLESAVFNPTSIRKTSVRHGLRTDAASRFEKGVDISNTVYVLKRAAMMIREIAGGQISSEIKDVYPTPKEKTQVALKYHYLKKLSGKNYHQDTIINVLEALGFEKIKEGMDEVWVAVPYSKPDISLPADIVEEILRIDGLDNIDIPSSITITPAIDANGLKEDLKEKLAGFLVGRGFNEIMTNSITDSKYYNEQTLQSVVKMINNLSADLDVMRPSMIETGLESLSYNINRKNDNLQFFEFGKTYSTTGVGQYQEKEHLAIYITGKDHEDLWSEKGTAYTIYQAKGLAYALLQLCGFTQIKFTILPESGFIEVAADKKKVIEIQTISTAKRERFGIKVPVFFVDLDFGTLISLKENKKITYKEVSKFPTVYRDLALVLDNSVHYDQILEVIKKTNLPLLKETRLFDVFENDKLGKGKKSLAINFAFLDEQKTLTDKEIDHMMIKLITGFEKQLEAEIRK
ncbi:phenylalanine--tRNA ligase subunit beta [Arachidicoccus terrestris]|uniref:phenylalanine--tRNA ligase subunit beta n=1 Tax=Arachidicoccus terrestris TaxID=2875539 RepID=UPI001CC61835|nr:phenylalanine--tRNA ligase subunit beta [Arachidicoccus terrestris]UAY57176.1 phenylalanine--tRNA ligase subunit beta [Arachidicoccus terrestris]